MNKRIVIFHDRFVFKKSDHFTSGNIMIVERIEKIIRENKVVIFSKTYCVYCQQVKDLFESLSEPYATVELDQIPDGQDYQDVLMKKTKQKTVPNVFINQVHIGGCDAVMQAYENNTLHDMLTGTYCIRDYDLVVIGGGSGGLSAAREAVRYGRRVAVCDFVQPTPLGTSWGLGGTCVNVGCIPKKIMHQAALTGTEVKDAHYYGWNSGETPKHAWEDMIEVIQNYIKSLNFNYKKQLREANISYLNERAVFVSPYEIQTTDKKGEEKVISADKFIIAVGGRPRYPDIPGAKEYGISSDDLFSLPHSPGKTLIVGASYVGLECAGILAGFGLDVTVMVRSVLLRGFDQQMANMVGEHMESIGVKFLRNTVPLSVEKISEEPSILSVSAITGEEVSTHQFNTVLFAIGRDPCTAQLGLASIDVDINENNGKIIVNDEEQTSVSNIYAIGDVVDGKPELTPVAIKAGRLLAMRLFGKCQMNMNYDLVPTTVFTPLEYGCVGFSEEAAVEKYGSENIEVYHSYFQPLEYTLQRRENFNCYAKLICLKTEDDLVIGLHVLGPNAGEMTQGFALAVKLKAKILDFHNLIGIHPTCAESFTTLYVTKSSGLSVTKTIC